MIIQTILLDPSRAVWTDEASNVSRLDPSGAIQADAEHPTRNRKVVEVRVRFKSSQAHMPGSDEHLCFEWLYPRCRFSCPSG
jgi:hypothetical protein